MNGKQVRFIALGALLAWLLGGCATEGAVEKDFGNSVRNMISAQKYTPPQAAQVQAGALKLDGQQGEKVLQTYRGAVASPQEIKNEITINVGN